MAMSEQPASEANSPAEGGSAGGTPVRVTRSGEHWFTAVNERGAAVDIGREGMSGSFTPGELLLAAVAGCSAVTTENLLVRRLGADAEIAVDADRTKSAADKHRFATVETQLHAALDQIDDTEERAKIVAAVHRAIGKYCTVSRTVEQSTPVHLDVVEHADVAEHRGVAGSSDGAD